MEDVGSNTIGQLVPQALVALNLGMFKGLIYVLTTDSCIAIVGQAPRIAPSRQVVNWTAQTVLVVSNTTVEQQ